MLLYVGRFTEVKRLPLLIEAYAQRPPGLRRAARRSCSSAASRASGRASTRSTRSAASARADVFLAGWHDHDELPDFLAASDVVVLPSVREQFGQVLVEGDGLRAAGDRGRRARARRDRRRTARRAGWSSPTTSHGLANALVEAVNRPAERRRRGAPPPRTSRERYAWPALAERVAEVYDDAPADATIVARQAPH